MDAEAAAAQAHLRRGLLGAVVEHIPRLDGQPAARLLTRALQPDPASRFQTAADFETALHPYIAGASAALSRTMDHLFGADIRDVEKRFASAVGTTGSTGKQQVALK